MVARVDSRVPRPYFPSLDGLRALAIVPIVWHHSTPHALDGALGRGPLGVDLFFVVSGFLITTLLVHERRTQGVISAGRFWLRRSLRIFPLYYLVLGAFALHAVFVRAHGPARDYFLESLPCYATYTSNWFQRPAGDHPIVFAFGWSLAAEEQFYLLWPLLLGRLRGFARPALAMLTLVLLDQAAERGWLAGVLDEGTALRIVRSFATPIGLGALLALCVGSSQVGPLCTAILGRRWSSSVALLVVFAAALEGWALLPTQIAMAALVGASSLRSDHVLAPLLENRAIRHLGTVSYGVYLLNVPVVSVGRAIVGDDAGPLFAFSLAGSVLIATLTFRWIERPFVALRERLRGSPSTAHEGSLPDAEEPSSIAKAA